MASSGRYAQRRGSLPQATTTIVPFHGISSWRHTNSSCMNSPYINKYRPGFRYVLVISSPKSVQYCAIAVETYARAFRVDWMAQQGALVTHLKSASAPSYLG